MDSKICVKKHATANAKGAFVSKNEILCTECACLFGLFVLNLQSFNPFFSPFDVCFPNKNIHHNYNKRKYCK